MSPQTVTDVASRLILLTGRNIDNLCAAPCPQGGNNRLWRIECASGRYAAKSYFRHPADPRDRLATESSFLTYARDAGLEEVPDIIGCDNAAGIAVYEWIDGIRPGREQIGAEHVMAAARFFRALNPAATAHSYRLHRKRAFRCRRHSSVSICASRPCWRSCRPMRWIARRCC